MSHYEKAGVSIDAGQEAVELMKDAVKSTHNANVLAGLGAFGGMFELTNLPENPTLIASTDGVGTKVKIAALLENYSGIGHDIVNHCVNDIACAGSGVRPLFFLDYVASSRLEPTLVASLVTGMSKACKELNCAVLGGETAEMPGVYQQDEFDVVGTIVALMDKTKVYPKSTLKAGNALIALPSSGPHTNGYSLIRSIFSEDDYTQSFDGISHLGEALLAPHRCYLRELNTLESNDIDIQGVAHITGGGLIENLPRILPEGHSFSFDRNQWTCPPLFKLIQEKGDVPELEMFRVFNMGLGMVIVLPQEQQVAALDLLPEAFPIGKVIETSEPEWI